MLNESNTAFIQYTVQCYLTSCPAPFFLLLFFSPTYFECIVKYSCLSANRSMTSIELGKWRKEWEMAELFDLITHLQSRPNHSLRSKREKKEHLVMEIRRSLFWSEYSDWIFLLSSIFIFTKQPIRVSHRVKGLFLCTKLDEMNNLTVELHCMRESQCFYRIRRAAKREKSK